MNLLIIGSMALFTIGTLLAIIVQQLELAVETHDRTRFHIFRALLFILAAILFCGIVGAIIYLIPYWKL